MTEIAAELGCTKSAVHNRLRQIDGRRSGKPKHRVRVKTSSTQVVVVPPTHPHVEPGTMQYGAPFYVAVPAHLVQWFGLKTLLDSMFGTTPGVVPVFELDEQKCRVAAAHASARHGREIVTIEAATCMFADVTPYGVANSRHVVGVRFVFR